MSLVVVGSVALDTIETPRDRVEEVLGGSAVHFSMAASLLGPVRLCGYVGTDFPSAHVELLKSRGVDVTGLQTKKGKTFRWSGRYEEDMNTRETVSLALNVFGEYEPEIPSEYRDSEFIFLANGSPVHQLHVMDQMRSPRFAVVDTMDHWIQSNRQELDSLFKRVDAVVVNDGEAALLTGLSGMRAAENILEMGPEYVIVKKGEHGAVMVSKGKRFLIPAYPTTAVRDPTGAGDSFAGGMMGYLASAGEVSAARMRRAIAYGTIIASFNVEGFGASRTVALSRAEVEERLRKLRQMLEF